MTFPISAQRFKGGLVIGLTTTQVSGDELAGFNKTGFVGGATVSTNLGNNFDVAMEILYIQKGSRKRAKADNDSSYLMKLNYVEVPLLISYTYKERIKVEAGPSFGKLLSSYEEDQSGEFPSNYRVPFKEYEMSINGGLSYRLYKGIYIHSRIATSLFPIRPHNSGQTYYFNRGQYNTVLMFTVRYVFLSAKQVEASENQ